MIIKLREYLENQKLHELNPKLSQSFGRRIYKLNLDDQNYWLKLHIKGQNHESEQSFLNEVHQYQSISDLNAHILLPFEWIDTQMDLHLANNYLGQALLISDSNKLFSENPQHLDLSKVIQILYSSLDVLDRLHQIGYLHGDLKKEHFRVQNFKNSSFLIDFEQSCHVDDVSNMKNTATPRYMAPELFHGSLKSIQTDLYALGIIWLEWLNQQKIKQISYLDWAKWHCQQLEVELFKQFEPLEDVLRQMLAKNKVNRCANIYQIKQILNKNV